ncbi:hypothetical protein LCGC14_1231340 [marine sediment metagenome]|uniref:Uncharacterized protein n=1 Tax=marine sediment metagenome TaxID=412755 RepID=A0A0F9LVN9_9ZZZZ
MEELDFQGLLDKFGQDGFQKGEQVILGNFGTNQTLLSLIFQKPVNVKNIKVEEVHGVIIRGVDLVTDEQVVGHAITRVPGNRNSKKVWDAVLDRQLGLGQIIVTYNLPTKRVLVDVGHDDQAFWRTYTIEGADVFFEISETYPRKPFEEISWIHKEEGDMESSGIWGKVITTEVSHQQMQVDYFAKREKVGTISPPQVYQPKNEPEAGNLVAIFVEPGAAHLVFGDEIAPNEELDRKYREVRLQVFGRTHDVESVEFIEGEVKFVNNAAFLNIYESNLHWSTREPYKRAVFTETWNHMLSAGGKWINVIRGGYRLVKAPILEGDRAAAEKWEPEKGG